MPLLTVAVAPAADRVVVHLAGEADLSTRSVLDEGLRDAPGERPLAAGLVAAFPGEVDPAIADRLLGGPAREPEAFGDEFVEADRHGVRGPNVSGG